jgi:hypothetical protein
MSDRIVSEYELIYIKQFLLRHLRDAGLSWEEIEAKITDLPAESTLRTFFINQFLDNLPLEERAAAAQRMLPKVEGVRFRITVLTVADQPSFDMPNRFEVSDLQKLITHAYGKQADGQPHNWHVDFIAATE